MNDAPTTSSLLEQPFNFEDFSKYLQGFSGGDRSNTTANVIVADLKRFFTSNTSIADSSKNAGVHTLSQLLNKQNIENFYTDLKQSGKAATTIAEKLRRLREAVKFIQLKIPHTDSATYMWAQKIVDFISNSTKRMSKPIKLQRQKHALKVADKLPLIDDASEVIKNQRN